MDLSHKRILVTGANGQLGSAIVNVFKHNHMDVIGTDRTMMDITNQNQVFQVVKQIKPQVIIHCAAYTLVDKAESEKELCYKTNVEGTRNLVRAAKELEIDFLYFSTDYVFDGTKTGSYETNDLPNPINYYGLTKYLGEEIVRTILTNYFIFRISWVFGPNGKNFVNTILKLVKEKDSLNVVNDQIGSPTYTIDLANFLLNKNQLDYGIHHLTNEGFISWYEFALEIVKISNSNCVINPISSLDYKTAAKRGKNSKISKSPTTQLKFWKSSLENFINFYTK